MISTSAYGWTDSETGERITQADIGRLVGFPGDFPWRHVGRGRGVRNVAQQAADAVCPMVAAAVFGRILGIADWEEKTRIYVPRIYAVPTIPRQRIEQMILFDEEASGQPQAA